MSMGNMGWIGGVINLLSGIGGMYESGKINKTLERAATAGLPFVREGAADMKKWGAGDWENFKTNYRPVANKLVDESNRAPDTQGVAGKVAADVAQNSDNITQAAQGQMFSHGIGPSSGAFTSMLSGAADGAAHDEGVGGALAKLGEEDRSNKMKLGVINMGRSANDATSMANAMGMVSAGGANYGKYATGLKNQIAGSQAQAGQGAGQIAGSWRRDKQYTWKDGAARDEANSQEEFMGTDQRYADGGLIRGPGDGTSDSVPAVIDGSAPARVSNGEYLIKANVVQKIGVQKLDAIVAAARGN